MNAQEAIDWLQIKVDRHRKQLIKLKKEVDNPSFSDSHYITELKKTYKHNKNELEALSVILESAKDFHSLVQFKKEGSDYHPEINIDSPNYFCYSGDSIEAIGIEVNNNE